MKTLHLIRHAKSSWAESFSSDAERPLNARGHKACRLMAQPILNEGCSFEHVFCSTAKRAQSTIEGIADSLPDHDIRWQLDEALYTFSSRDLLRWIRARDDELNNIVIIGHNPGLTDFCNEMGSRYIVNIPTCAYTRLEFPLDAWGNICPGSGRTISFITPKLVKAIQGGQEQESE
jgi:phosphohistidine phosphatase